MKFHVHSVHKPFPIDSRAPGKCLYPLTVIFAQTGSGNMAETMELNSQLSTSYSTSNTMYGCSHSVISLGRWSGSVNYMLLTSSHSEPLTRKTYSMVVTDRQTDGGQMDRNVTLCGLYLCDVTRLPQYAIIPSHCPITAVHQHRTERPHCSLIEFVNRTRYVTSRVMGINDHVNSIPYAAERD